MLNVLILEDEEGNRRLLKRLIKDYIQDAIIVAECETVSEALSAIKKCESNLIILLDIELGNNENGFDFIQMLENRNDFVIVISAFPEYAIKAFRFEVVDFVSKPILIPELVEAFERVRKKTQNVEIEKKLNTVGIQLFNKTMFIEESSILLIRSDLSGTKVHLDTGKIINSVERIGQLELRLNKEEFLRMDKSNLLQIRYVKEYFLNQNGQLLLDFGQVEPLLVARRRKKEILKKLNNYFQINR